MAKTLRVHTLAKELGVPSKAIIDKCNAEGVEPPLKNHMSAISVGLGASIREWFTPGADVTTIEVADEVNIEELHRQRQRESRARLAGGPEDGDTVVEQLEREPEAAPIETIPQEASEEAPAMEEITAKAEADVAEVEPHPEVVEPPKPAPVMIVSTPPAPKAERGAAAVVSAPPKPPEPVAPAGPQLVPAPAALRGPRVVRIEAPDPVRPRPSRPPMGGGPGPGIVPGPRPELGEAPGRGRGPKRKTDSDAANRARSPRRHGNGAEAQERLKEWRDQDVLERKERLASATGHGLKARRSAERRRMTTPQPAAGRKKEIEITTPISVKDFCSAVGSPFSAVSARLFEHTKRLFRINELIEADVAELVAIDLGLTLKVTQARTAYEQLQDEVAARPREHIAPRPPVVAMLGHVDHGKTSLLDAIRKTNVAAGEAGGITQHIGAYRIDRGDWHVTFLDTPGHEAFTSMRARGANLTDVVVLVIAADDGVMPQTAEALNHARAAGVPVVVALNKSDLPNIDFNRLYAQLAQYDLTPSEWGGTTDVIKTSATTGMGVDELIAHLSTLSDLLELRADPTLPAVATVIEARMQEGRGPVAQVLVREGTLRVGDVVLCGPAAGRVRSLLDDRGRRIDEAGPGTPVAVIGLDGLPLTGDSLYALEDLSRAKTMATEIANQRRQDSLSERSKPQTLAELLKGSEASEAPELPLVVKSDVQGSLEALTAKLREFEGTKARLKLLHQGIGAVSEADVALAKASGAIIIGFHVVAEERARQAAEQAGVEIRTYRIIYEVLDDIQKALQGLLEPTYRQENRSRVEVRQIFHVSKVGVIAGCLVVDGVIARSHKVRLVRDGRIILEGGALDSLKRFKDDAREVRAGLECGLKIAGFDDIKPGDIVESYELIEVAQEL